MRLALLSTALISLAVPALAQDEAARVRAVLEATPLIDGHNDLPWQVSQRWQGDARQLDVTQDLSRLDPPIEYFSPIERRRRCSGAKIRRDGSRFPN